jgi:hypothetical protein
VIVVATKIVSLLLLLDPGSRIQDPGSRNDKNQDPLSGKKIPDPQHWKNPWRDKFSTGRRPNRKNIKIPPSPPREKA